MKEINVCACGHEDCDCEEGCDCGSKGEEETCACGSMLPASECCE